MSHTLINTFNDFRHGLNQSKKNSILKNIAVTLKQHNLTKSIEFVRNIEKNEYIKNKLHKVLTNNNGNIKENLFLEGFLTPIQKTLIEQSKESTYTIFNEISNGKKDSRSFIPKLFLSTLLVPTLAIIISANILYGVKTKILNQLFEVLRDIASNKGMEDFVRHSWFMENIEYFTIGSYVLAGLFILAFYGYTSLYHTKTWLIYKYMKPHYEHDLLDLLKIIMKVKETTGSNLTTTATILEKHMSPVGLRGMFRQMKETLKNRSSKTSIHFIFKQYGFREEICHSIKFGESAKVEDFWKGLELAIEYAKNIEESFERKYKAAKSASFLIGMTIVALTFLYISYYNWSIQSITKAIT